MKGKILATLLCCVMLMQLFPGVTRAASGLCIQNPSIAYDSKNDNYLVAYEYQEDSDLKQVIRYAIVGSDGSWGEELQASEDTKFQRDYPKVAFAHKSNTYLVVWWQAENIVGQIINNDGSLPGDKLNNVIISTKGENPQIAYDSENDRFLVVWQEYVSSWDQGDLYGQIVNPDGTLFGKKITIMKSYGSQIDAAVEYDSANKKFLVTWTDDRALRNSYDIFGKFINLDGTPHKDFKISDKEGYFNQQQLDLEFDDKNGQFLLTWSARTSEYGDFNIFGRLLQLDKDYTTDDRFLISKVKGENLYRPSAVFDNGQNSFLIVFEQDNNSYNCDILGQFIDEAGNLVGTTFPIVQTPLNESGQRVVPTSTPGKYLLAYDQGTSKGQWSKSIGTLFVGDPSSTLTVTFDKNGGDTEANPTTKMVIPGETVGTLPAEPTRTGYTFSGWNTQADGSGTILTVDTLVTKNITVYAQWMEVPPIITYTVTYDGNGGEGDPPIESDKSAGKTFTAAANSFIAPSGKQFKEWNTNADGTGEGYAPGADITMPEANLTLYAIWEDIPVNPSISPKLVNYDPKDPADVTTFITWGSNAKTVTDVVYGSETLIRDTQYKIDENKLTIIKDYFISLDMTEGKTVAFAVYFDDTNRSILNLMVTAREVPPTVYTVTFDKNGGDTDSTPASKNVILGETVGTFPMEPTRTGYTFSGWNTQADGSGTVFTVDTPVTENITVYAQWMEVYNGGSGSSGGHRSSGTSTPKTNESVKEENSKDVVIVKNPDTGNTSPTNTLIPYYLKDGQEIIVKYSFIKDGQVHFVGDKATEYLYKDNSKGFSDIEGHWAKEDIDFVTARELLGGTGNGKFSPDTSMTRGMMVTVLGRLWNLGLDDITTSRFTDVSTDSYYAPYVEWVAQNGIVQGVGDNMFAPDKAITREEMAVILANFVDFTNSKLTEVDKNPALFSDDSEINLWAKASVSFMQKTGIIKGKLNNLFDPKGTATRAEVCVILKRFISNSLS